MKLFIVLVGMLAIAFPGFSAEPKKEDVKIEKENLITAAELTMEMDLEGLDEEELEGKVLDGVEKHRGHRGMHRRGMHRHRRPHHRYPRHRYPRHRYPRHRYPTYPRSRVVCKAENGRGMVFRASGQRPYWVQERAMNKCYSQSYNCYEMGCFRRY